MQNFLKKPFVLAVGFDPWYLLKINRWLEPFCEKCLMSTSFEDAKKITACEEVDIFLVDGFGKEMAMAFQNKFPGSLICLLTTDPYLVCNDPRVHCMQRPVSKKTTISCIMNKWKQCVSDEKRSVMINHHLDLIRVYNTDPQDRVEVLYLKLKRDFEANFEAVALRHEEHRNRTNFCITLQRGCPGGCLMCNTAKITHHTTNLTCHEIAAQVAHLLMTYTAVGAAEEIVIAAHGGGDPRFCLNEYCNAVKIIEHTYNLNARYIATSIGGEKTWKTMFSRLEGYDVSYEISAISTDEIKRNFVLPATKHDLPLSKQIEMLADNAAKHARLYKYRHLLTVGLNDSLKEAKEIARLVVDTPHRVIIQKMETGCLPQFPKEVSDQAVNDFMYMLSEEGVDCCFNRNIGEGPVKCGMHIAPQDRQVLTLM